MRLILTLLICLSYFFIQGQDTDEGFVSVNNTYSNLVEGSSIRTFDTRYRGVKGHPYLFDHMVPIELTLKKGERKITGNLHLIDKQLVWTSGDKIAGTIPFDLIESFSIEKSEWFFLFFKRDLVPAQLHFSTNDFKLLRIYSKKFVEADYGGAYAAGRTSDEFAAQSRYVIYRNRSDVETFKFSIKNLSKLLELPPAKVKRTLREQRLDINDPLDYVQIIEVLATL